MRRKGRDGVHRVNNYDHQPVVHGKTHHTGFRDRGYPLEWWGDKEPAPGEEQTVMPMLEALELSFPATLDLSLDPAFPPIGNQNGTGSCAAWAQIYYALGYLTAKNRGWVDVATNPAHRLNMMFVYNRTSGAADMGSFMLSDANIMMDWGCPTMDVMPLVASDYVTWGNEAAMREALIHRAVGVTISGTVASVVNDIKTILNQGIPVTIAINAASANYNLITSDGGMTAAKYDDSAVNHGQCIVGYDDNKTVGGNETGCFIIVNSWGASEFYSKYYMSYACIQKIKGANVLFPTYATYVPGNPNYLAKVTFGTAMLRNLQLYLQLNDALGNALKKTLLNYTLNFGGGAGTFPNPLILDISVLDISTYVDADIMRLLLVQAGTNPFSGTITGFEVEYFPSYNVNGTGDTIAPNVMGLPLTAFGSVGASFNKGSTINNTTLTAVTDNPSVTLGNTIHISGKLSSGTVYLSGQTITFMVSNGDAIPSVVTDSTGRYTVAYKPSKVGTVTVTANYAGE